MPHEIAILSFNVEHLLVTKEAIIPDNEILNFQVVEIPFMRNVKKQNKFSYVTVGQQCVQIVCVIKNLPLHLLSVAVEDERGVCCLFRVKANCVNLS